MSYNKEKGFKANWKKNRNKKRERKLKDIRTIVFIHSATEL